jgi:hypothetical protein
LFCPENDIYIWEISGNLQLRTTSKKIDELSISFFESMPRFDDIQAPRTSWSQKVSSFPQMFLLLLSHSLSYFCTHTIEVSSSSPRRFSYYGSDGDLVCVNATVPYLAVAFEHTSLLQVRYFTSTEWSNLVRRGRFVFPSESTGIAFGPVLGHLEVQVLLPGVVSLSTFAYPTDCAEQIGRAHV